MSEKIEQKLEAQQELRVEVDAQMSIKLVQGTAEIFGAELALERKYSFSASKFAVFTWHGCTLSIEGECHWYVGEQTPMVQFLQLHEELEKRRTAAKDDPSLHGPTVVVVGPTDTGKSTLCKVLTNYAVRMEHAPVYVDLDVGQGSITPPGTISAVPVDLPIDPEVAHASTPTVTFDFHGLMIADRIRFISCSTLLFLRPSLAREEHRAHEASHISLGTGCDSATSTQRAWRRGSEQRTRFRHNHQHLRLGRWTGLRFDRRYD
jgi:hypothetical protein